MSCVYVIVSIVVSCNVEYWGENEKNEKCIQFEVPL